MIYDIVVVDDNLFMHHDDDDDDDDDGDDDDDLPCLTYQRWLLSLYALLGSNLGSERWCGSQHWPKQDTRCQSFSLKYPGSA